MKISVVIPSRLASNPLADGGRLYLHRAIASVRRQTIEADAHVVVGLSPGGDRVAALHADADLCVTAASMGQAAAINEAVKATKSDIIAFLEDDDQWDPKRLEYGLAALEQGFDFTSSNQREVTEDGAFVRVNDFATPSGWLMTRDCWNRVGPMDETFKWHIDNEWLGRLNRTGLQRVHLVEKDAERPPRRPWLDNVMRFSVAGTTQEREPLVTRTVNPNGGMAKIASDPIAAAESRTEHVRMLEKFGVIPW